MTGTSIHPTELTPRISGESAEPAASGTKGIRAAEVEAPDEFDLFDAARVLNAVASSDGFFLKTGGPWKELLGWSPRELANTQFFSYLHPDDAHSTSVALAKLMGGSETAAFRNRFRKADGSYLSIGWRVCRSADGSIYAIGWDATHMSIAEQILIKKQTINNSIADFQRLTITSPDLSLAISGALEVVARVTSATGICLMSRGIDSDGERTFIGLANIGAPELIAIGEIVPDILQLATTGRGEFEPISAMEVVSMAARMTEPVFSKFSSQSGDCDDGYILAMPLCSDGVSGLNGSSLGIMVMLSTEMEFTLQDEALVAPLAAVLAAGIFSASADNVLDLGLEEPASPVAPINTPPIDSRNALLFLDGDEDPSRKDYGHSSNEAANGLQSRIETDRYDEQLALLNNLEIVIRELASATTCILACTSEREALNVIANFLPNAFTPGSAELLSLIRNERSDSEPSIHSAIGVGDCWSLRTGNIFHSALGREVRCSHLPADASTICIPLTDGAEQVGVITLELCSTYSESPPFRLLYVLADLAKGFSSALANLRQIRELKVAAYLDPLTQVGNRRVAEQAIAIVIARSRSIGEAFGIVMVDIDHFKVVNDRFGHDTGDRVLTKFAQCLRAHLREGDAVARLGGEEFLLVLQNVTPLEIKQIIQELVVRIERETFVENMTITASMGALHVLTGDCTSDELLHVADSLLYEAKNNGRNQFQIGEYRARGRRDGLGLAIGASHSGH